MANSAVVRKGGPFIEVSANGQEPLHPRVYRALEQPLIYTHITHLFGAKAYNPKTGEHQPRKAEKRRLFQYDAKGRFVCLKGFYPRIRGMLQEQGLTVEYIDKDPPKAPNIYEAQWDRLFQRFELRPRQDACLAQIDMHDYGTIVAPPAFGKTYVMAMMGVLYPKAKIDIVTKRKDVVGRIRDLLTRWIPSVGQVGGGKKRPGRVTVFTADSLHHSDHTADFLLADEGHELMTDRLSEQLAYYGTSRNYTFTATPDMRLDNAHHRMEGLFGPRIFEMTQQEAEANSLVAPVIVQWLPVEIECNPAAPYSSLVAQKRHGIWRNQWRNQTIAGAARSFREDNQQVLILVDTLDHALHLRKVLPEAELCYSEGALADIEKRRRLIRDNLLTADDEAMTTQRRVLLRQRFESRDLMLCIATGVWSVGVSFDSLNVLIRADAGASETSNIQLPGRVCRIDPSTNKQCGILIDFNDSWDAKFRGRAADRRRDYHQRGWTQLMTDGTVWLPGKRINRGTL